MVGIAKTSGFARLCAAVCAIAWGALVLVASPASAQVVWEDYQGRSNILGTSNNNKPGPDYENNSGSSPTNLANLRTISGNIANATRTGTDATINYAQSAMTSTTAILCNPNNPAVSSYDGPGTGAACMADAQGRVAYALVRFPTTGTFTFAVAHDDEIDLDLSSDYTNTNYRTAAYNLPVGSAAGWTANENTYETLAGVFSSPTANACILLRLYWNNAGGIHFLRLQWTKPGGVTEIVPASQLFDPGNPASSAGCTGSITGAGKSIVVNKIVAASGRASVADQFTVALKNSAGSTTLATATTSGSGTGQQASTGAAITANSTTYQVTDAMAAGSTNTLAAAYAPTIACTRNGTAFTPGGASPTWTVATNTSATEAIVCNITNTRRTATLRINKTWVGAKVNDAVTIPATTGFTNNSAALNAVANTANETDLGTAFTVLVGDTGTLGAENFTTGNPISYDAVVGCSSGTLSGTNGKLANTLTIPVAAAGGTVTCTYTNTFFTRLSVTKISNPIDDTISLSNPKAIPGASVRYCILITNIGTQNATTVSATDTLPALVGYLPNTLRSGTSCAGATTIEDDDAADGGEVDPFRMSISGTTITGTTATLAPNASFAMVFNTIVN
jgi:uncharacterized repeat protein (TIGR01451 family)